MEIGNLALEKRRLVQYIEEEEDEEEVRRYEKMLKEVEERLKYLKDYVYVSNQDKETRKKSMTTLTEENKNSQEWHDSRYYKAIEAGVKHHRAWVQEKSRRRATLHRKKSMAERAEERQRLEEEWIAEHRAGKRSQDDYQKADTENLVSTMETEVIVEAEEGMKVQKGGKKTSDFQEKIVRKPLSKKELESFRQEPKEEEKRVMAKKKADIFKKRVRKMTDARRKKRNGKKKLKKNAYEPCRALGWTGECSRGIFCTFSHDQKVIEKLKGTHCRFFIHGSCRFGAKVQTPTQ